MKLTLDQAKRIAKDFEYLHGAELEIEEGQVGELPYIVIGPYEKDGYEFKEFIEDIKSKIRFHDFENYVYPSSTSNYNVYIVFEDYSADGLLIHDELEEWLKVREEKIDYLKYGIE